MGLGLSVGLGLTPSGLTGLALFRSHSRWLGPGLRKRGCLGLVVGLLRKRWGLLCQARACFPPFTCFGWRVGVGLLGGWGCVVRGVLG